jgi:hypothetical protein
LPPEDVVPLEKPTLQLKCVSQLMKRKCKHSNHEGDDATPPGTKQRPHLNNIGSDDEKADDPDTDMPDADDPIKNDENSNNPTPSDVEEPNDPDMEMPDDMIETNDNRGDDSESSKSSEGKNDADGIDNGPCTRAVKRR